MEADMFSRPSRRHHQDREEHDIFPLHDDDANFGEELNYNNSSQQSDSEDYSADEDFPCGTQAVDYTNLEAFKQHRLQGRLPSQRGGIPTPAAGNGGVGGITQPTNRQLRFGGNNQSSDRERRSRYVRLYTNPPEAGQYSRRGHMRHSRLQSQRNVHASQEAAAERISNKFSLSLSSIFWQNVVFKHASFELIAELCVVSIIGIPE